MLNAIFHCDSLFLDQRPDGSLEYRSGSRPARLEGGVNIAPLEEKQPLFSIETESGAKLILSPESVFSLRKTPDGRVVRYIPVDGAFAAAPPRLDWSAPVDGIDKSDLRRFALIGFVVANGFHSTERSRPSNITLPTMDLGEDVHRFLEAIATDRDYGGFGRTRRPTVRILPDGTVFIKSRTLTHAASWQIEPNKTQELMFNPMELGRREAWAFAYGLLNGAVRAPSRYVIAHRSEATLRSIKHMLELRFGVSADIRESLSTAEHLSIISGGNQLVIELEEPALEAARAVGLIESQGIRPDVSPYRAEKIVKIETIPFKSTATIVTGNRDDYPYPLTVNTFVFASEFDVNDALTDLAAHPTILTDPSDPAKLIEQSPVHYVRGRKVND
ncbi:hypothetical protein [Mesorhizobium sp. M8A.F.Ca.ET.021.01.1.1]|uniref:hypothetical protein n=1 Tax=Mesorhizobium sp. M8A.F.Ca.ET.021.01.1.1 TaxID=2496757 RepID=UPI000FD356E0|nr:hypothetical protein [Mesorhizobium sp. M8A.F.Ca.ET.021.01.1.1]RUW57122.1 hypothetical protein EOA36_00635 [Mesorhizobium sp. M8A.F.Ca.ET.021.01.1.1]